MDHVTISGSDVLVGLTLNNNPGIQDPFNTLPAWGFPYTNSDLAPGPAAATMFDGGFEMTVLGTTAYAKFENGLYTEAASTSRPASIFLSALGADEGPGQIDGAAPYVRVAWQKDLADNSNFEVGAFGFFPSFYPDNDRSTGRTDDYSDFGVDASYQFLGRRDQRLHVQRALYPRGAGPERDASARRIGAHERHARRFPRRRLVLLARLGGRHGATLRHLGLARSAALRRHRTFSPNSTGVRFQIDATPWGKRRLALRAARFNMRVGAAVHDLTPSSTAPAATTTAPAATRRITIRCASSRGSRCRADGVVLLTSPLWGGRKMRSNFFGWGSRAGRSPPTEKLLAALNSFSTSPQGGGLKFRQTLSSHRAPVQAPRERQNLAPANHSSGGFS